MNSYILALLISILGVTGSAPDIQQTWTHPCRLEAMELRSHNQAAEQHLERTRPLLLREEALGRAKNVRADLWLELTTLKHWVATNPSGTERAACATLQEEAEDQLFRLEFTIHTLRLKPRR